MIRVQVQFTPEQMAKLKALAVRRNTSVSSLVRQAVDAQVGPAGPRFQRALAQAGRFRSGLEDLSEQHDKYLAEDLVK